MPVVRNPDGTVSPPSLLELCIQSVALHVHELAEAKEAEGAPLKLPAEVAGRVLAHSASRGWLDLETIRAMHGCPILSLAIPGCALVDLSWAQTLSTHSECVRLDLSGAPFLTDAAVALIGKLPQLRELNLSSCASLSDAALHHLAGVSTLQLLQLEALPKVTDAGVQHLEKLPSLRWLSLAGCTHLKGPGFATSLSRLGSRLHRLDLSKVACLDDDALSALSSALTELRALRLGWCYRLTSRALTSLANLPRLTALDLAHTRLDDAALCQLSQCLTRLRELSLRGCAVSDAGLARCRGFSRMESLSLRTCEVGNGCVSALQAMPRLKALDLGFTDVTDEGLLGLHPLSRLTALNLDSCRLSA